MARQLRPIRRLTRAECDLMGFEGPLILSVRQLRALFGPWRATNAYVVHRSDLTSVWVGTKRELLRLGVDPDVG